MCGIAGFVRDDSLETNNLRIRRMTSVLRHRGPDDQDWYVDQHAALGHTRLSIIDLASGHQPIANEDGSLQIVFNGEIFNYQPLRAELLGLGHIFSTRSDTEVIIHAFEQWGAGCLDRLNGQFAFAIWDRGRRSMFVARDRIGIIPAYYRQDQTGFSFASEIKALLAEVDLPSRIHANALNRYLGFGYTWDDQTLFQDIRKLPPGHYVYFRDGKPEISCYWNLAAKAVMPRISDFRKASEELESLLSDSIRLRLISDVPLGAFLSGGLDSSIMVAVASGMVPGKLNTFSVSFRDEAFDESSFAAKVARRYATSHHVLVGEEKAESIIEDVVWHLDEPISDQATIPTYLLSRLTRQHVTVALSGDGSDELFGGYNKYIALLLEDRVMRHLPRSVQAPLMAWIRKRMPFRDDFYDRNASMPQRYFSLLCAFTAAERTALFRNPSAVYACEDEIAGSLPEGLTPLQQAQLIDIRYWLVNDILVKTDRMSMAAGLETRVPYLDHRIIEFALRCTDDLKIRGVIGKYLLKMTYRDRLPFSVVWRKKQGFNYPLEDVYPDARVEEYFRDSSLYEILDRTKVRQIVANRRVNAFYRRQFRNLFFLFIWNRVFLEQRRRR